MKSDDLRYHSCEFRYGDVFTHTNVDELQGRIILQDEHASISKIIDVEKLAPGSSCTPDNNSRRITNFCFVEPSDQCSDDVGITDMKSRAYWRRYASQSFMPAIFAMA